MKLTSTIYACLAVTSTLATAQNRTGDWPKRLDVELVYLRNTTYPSQNVLPVVFAIHNPAAFWPYHFNFTWDLDIKVSPNESAYRASGGGFNRIMHEPAEVPIPRDIGDPLMIINTSYALNGLAEGRANLSWYFGFPKPCPNKAAEDFSTFSGLMLNGSMEFTISNSSGVALNPLNSTKGCSKQVGSFIVEGGLPIDGASPPSSCPVIMDKPSLKEDCGMQIDNALAKSITDVMFNGSSNPAECKWPNPMATILDEMCSKTEQSAPPGSSGQSAASSLVRSAAWVVAMSIFSAVLLL
jgi:hypothetical protein